MTFRAFIAIEVPVSDKLQQFSKAIEKTGADLKMVNLRNMHITLKFLGDIDKAMVPEIETVLKDSVAGLEPFTMRLKGSGAFPNMNRINVVWAGLENAETVGIIAERINTGLAKLGFEPDRKKFSPHVTIARTRSPKNREMLAFTIEQFTDRDFGEIPVERVILKKSVLTPSGPIYSDVVSARI